MQLTFLERKVSQRTLRRAARLSANESFPPAPGFSRVSGCPLASALNSRRVAARDNSRPWQLAIARAHRTASARPRPSAWALNSRPLAARYRSCSSRGQRTSAAQCLGCQFAPMAARYRSCSSRGQRTSAAQCPGSQFAPLAARYRSCSSNHQRTSAAQCLGSQIAPLAARYRSCSSNRQRTSAGVAPRAIRAKGRRLNAAPVQKKNARAHRGPSEASVKVF